MTTPIIFLETTIQIKRVLAKRAEQDRLETQLRSMTSSLVTSNYVWMEYQRTVIADYAHVHALMTNYHGWGDVIAHLLTGQRAFRPRTATRCTQIVGWLYNESQTNWDHALYLLDNALNIDLHAQFWTHVKPVPDHINCDLVQEGVTKQVDGIYTVADSCRQETATCQLPQFLAENQLKLQTIADYLTTHPKAIKNQKRVEQLLAKIIANPNTALGQGTCWPLGDVIIALQVPSNALLWTIDPDFKAITTALELPLYHFVTPPADPIN